MLFSDFGNISSCTLYKLFEQYCKSFYGLSLCKLSSSDFNELEVLYRKCMPRVLRVHYRTHNSLLTAMSGRYSLKHSAIIRVCRLILKMKNSGIALLQYFVNCTGCQTVSNMGDNISDIMKFVPNVNLSDLYSHTDCPCVRNQLDFMWNNTVSDVACVAHTCWQLIDVHCT